MSRGASSVAKGIAILMMLFHHLFYLGDRVAAYGVVFAPFEAVDIVLVARSFKICVAVFVFISAYGTYKSVVAKKAFDGPSLNAYCVTHAAKLLVGYWVIFVVFQLIGLAVSDHNLLSVYFGNGKLKGLLYILIDFMGLASLLGTPTFNATWWYMSLALLLIFLLPLLVALAQKIGSLWMPVLFSGIPALAGFSMNSVFFWWMFTASLGLVCAQYGLFERVSNGLLKTTFSRIVILLALVFLLCITLYVRQRIGTYYWLFDGVAAFAVCMVAHCLDGLRGVNFLSVLGKHSMNIFLCHTFIYSYFFMDLIYGLPWFGLMIIVLVVTSLICSVLIELLKEKSGLNRRVKDLLDKMEERLLKQA